MTELVREHDAGVGDGIAVVFVHDVGGKRRDTWMRDPGDATGFWPQWLGREAGCDTWTAGYDADPMAWRETASALHVHGLALMDRLATEPGLTGRPLLLIGHGVGGLLIKKAILHAMSKGAPRHRRLAGRIQGLAFVATPQKGAELALLTQALCVRLRTPTLRHDFGHEDASLRALQGEFSALCSGWSVQVRVFAESKAVPTGRKWLGLLKVRNILVSHDAANPHVPGETVMVLPEDHFSICKPQGSTNPLHRAIVSLIDVCRAVPFPAAVAASVEIPTPVAQPQPSASVDKVVERPALLENASDFRLQSCESKLYGRDRELTRILAFLDNDAERAAVVAPRTVDMGGLGKTELCKAALKIWMGRDSGRIAFFIALPEKSGPREFMHALAHGIGLGAPANVEQLTVMLPPGLYFLDNLGALTMQEEGCRLLSAMRDTPGVRILASSRCASPTGFGAGIDIDALPKSAALDLFRDLWRGSDILPVDTVLGQFVEGDLQRHALSICLVARLGDFFAYDEIVKRWRQQQAARAGESRDGLAVCLELTAAALSTKAGALPMWIFAAGCEEGVDESELCKFEAAGPGSTATRDFLQHHRILERRGNRFLILEPLARFALEFQANPANGEEQNCQLDPVG